MPRYYYPETEVVALGLPTPGDAFLVRSGAFRSAASVRKVLIDTGPPSAGVAARLRAGGIRRLDVLVLTHCDDDHIGGAYEVLVRLAVAEVWLPASWGRFLLRAAMATEDELRVLLADVNDALGDLGSDVEDEGDAVDRWADGYYEEGIAEALPEFEQHRPEEEVDLDAGIEAVDRMETDDRRLAAVLGRARAMAAIVRAARGRIRWFSYADALQEARRGRRDPWRSQGKRGWLTIVNAVERRASDLTPPPSLAMALALTIQNEQALVPYVWVMSEVWDEPEAGTGGVLLCSDSDFAFTSSGIEVPWWYTGLVAAPHHGSANPRHDRVYDMATSVSYGGLWMRSHATRRFPTWPGPRWLALPSRRRFCTTCRRRGAVTGPTSDLLFHGGDGRRWRAAWPTPTCSCS